jgi:riboflavin kinase/FMN adenylyltransferase
VCLVHRWTDPAQIPPELRRSVVTLGNFDGVHRGHRAVLDRLLEEARVRGLPAVAVTFDPHPVAVLHPERAPQLITPGPLRDDLLSTTGIDGLLVLEFTPEFAAQSPEDFVVATLVGALGAQALVVGEDTRFGRRNSGDVSTLRMLGGRHGFDVVALADLGDGARWSSSAVRAHLAAGEVAAATEILGRPHRVVGTVVHGAHRGRDLGYPTANLSQDALGLVPADGVYAGWLTRLDLPAEHEDRTLPAAASVGTNPTFAGPGGPEQRTVEAYALDRTDLDLYGEQVAVEFVEHIRPTLRFDSVEELRAAMGEDVEHCRRLLSSIVPS